ncbi:MAG: nucleotide sugar dehydrogenase [candidate division Zixibacteria bacterium]|nr:nucleotide sugar dehydrogenase [candidate division Zixibacteria bacterium]
MEDKLVATLEKKIKDKKAVVGIIGLGYVGLPLAVEYAKAGFHVIGIDVSQRKVDIVNAGQSDIDDIPSEQVEILREAKRLEATTDFSQLEKADCIPICVPTPLNKTKDPDVSYILSAVEKIAKYLRKGQLIILESTTYPGTTDELIQPILEKTGLVAGKDFFLAFSPERVDPGNQQFNTANTPKVVGGITEDSTHVARVFYEQIISQVVPVSSTRAAEMVKLLENTFRSVNIALVNEVALMCDRLGIDVWEVIDAAATKPFGFLKFYPGPGLGGHCIPIDPHYLSWKLRSLNYYARFIELAGDINSHMPEYVVDLVAKALNKDKKAINGSRVAVLGIAYKKDISDVRESPALDIIRLLQDRGAKITYYDSYVPSVMLDGGELKSGSLTENALKKADCTVIITDHSNVDYKWVVEKSRLVVDTRNATRDLKSGKSKVTKL